MNKIIKINYLKIMEIYGEDILNNIKDYESIIYNNIKTMYEYGIYEIEEIIESFFLAFLQENKIFKYNLLKIIKKLGPDYKEIIYNDNSHLEKL